MGTKTISLEDSAYEKLKAAKQGDESFSEVVHRLTTGRRKSYKELSGLLQKSTVEAVAESILAMRQQDTATEAAFGSRKGKRHGRPSRQ